MAIRRAYGRMRRHRDDGKGDCLQASFFRAGASDRSRNRSPYANAVGSEYYACGCTQMVLRSHAPAGIGYPVSHKGGNLMYFGGVGGLILVILLVLFLTGRL